MSEKSDITEPPERQFLLKSSMKKFFNKLFNKPRYLSDRILSRQNNTPATQFDPNSIINNFNSFAKKTAENVMIPRADIISVNYDISLEELNKIIIKHSHTRTLIHKDNLDNIVGFVHIKDLFDVVAKSKKFNLKKLTRKHIVSPQSMTLIDLLKQMQVHRTQIAVIVDEYGGTDGIVTIEDIIEAIVGRIDDEHDTDLDNENFKILKPGLIIANARMEVEELERILSVKLKEEDDEFETIGGLVLAKVGTVPDKGQIVHITDEVTIEIMDSTPRAIKQLKISCNKNNI